MPQSISQKLRIKEGMTLLTINAPEDFIKELQPLPNDVIISDDAKQFDQVHWFVSSQAKLDKEVKRIIRLIKNNVLCWTYYPKLTGKIKTDLTRDKGWDSLLKNQELKWLSMISFNETWTAFSFRAKTQADEKKAVQAKPRAIFNYADPVSKTILLPEDVAKAFKTNTAAAALFHKLAFSHRKEYIEWIVTAKRDETRSRRVQETIERLEKGWKNPTNM